MSLVICARNVTRINRKTGSIVQHAIVISRTRLASNFTLKYRPKAIQPVRRTIVAVCVPPQWTETNRDNCTCVVTNIATLAKCLCLKITCVTWKRPRRKKQPRCWKENERKGSTRTMMCKNGSSLTLNAHKTRWFSAMKATSLANESYVEIATNLTVIPIHVNKDTYQRRWQCAKIVIDHPVVPSDTCPIYVWCIRCAKNALTKTRLTSIAFVAFANTKSEYSRVLTHVMNSVNGCFQRKTKTRVYFVITFEGTIAIPSLVTCTKMLSYQKWSWMDQNSWVLRYLIWRWNSSTLWISFQWLFLKSRRLSIFLSWPKDTFHISLTRAITSRPSLIVYLTWSTIIREGWCQRIVKNLCRGTTSIRTTLSILKKK